MAETYEPDRDFSFLTAAERNAMTVYGRALTADTLISLSGILRSLGIQDEAAINRAVGVMREASAETDLRGLETARGAMHALQQYIGRERTAVATAEPQPSEVLVIPDVTAEEASVESVASEATQETAVPLDRADEPSKASMQTVERPSANIDVEEALSSPLRRIFSFMDEEQMVALAKLSAEQQRELIAQLAQVYEAVSAKPEFAEKQMDRLGLLFQNCTFEDIAKRTGASANAVYQSTLSLKRIFERAQDRVVGALGRVQDFSTAEDIAERTASVSTPAALAAARVVEKTETASDERDVAEVEEISFERRVREAVYEFCDSLGMSRGVKKLVYTRLHDNPNSHLFGPELRQRWPQITRKYAEALDAYPDLFNDVEKAVMRSMVVPDVENRRVVPMAIGDVQGKYRRELEAADVSASECVVGVLEKINNAYAEAAA